MSKEELQCLVGKYLNGYKIVRIENDRFIKGQINLFTDEWKYGVFNDRALVKFYVRSEPSTAKAYQELVDKENTNLKQALIDIRKYINNWTIITPKNIEKKMCDMRYGQDILQIIDKFLGDEK